MRFVVVGAVLLSVTSSASGYVYVVEDSTHFRGQTRYFTGLRADGTSKDPSVDPAAMRANVRRRLAELEAALPSMTSRCLPCARIVPLTTPAATVHEFVLKGVNGGTFFIAFDQKLERPLYDQVHAELIATLRVKPLREDRVAAPVSRLWLIAALAAAAIASGAVFVVIRRRRARAFFERGSSGPP